MDWCFGLKRKIKRYFYPPILKKEEEKYDYLCTICFTGRANTAFIPCGHAFYCDVCVKELEYKRWFGKK